MRCIIFHVEHESFFGQRGNSGANLHIVVLKSSADLCACIVDRLSLIGQKARTSIAAVISESRYNASAEIIVQCQTPKPSDPFSSAICQRIGQREALCLLALES